MAVGSRPLVPSRWRPAAVRPRVHGAGDAAHAVGALRRADQAADHRAAAHHHAARRWSWPRTACPRSASIVATLVGGTLAAGGANAINMVHRPRHRPADAPDAGPAARHRARRAPGAPSSSPSVLEVVAFAAAVVAGQPAVGRARPRRHRCSTSFVYTIWLKRTSHPEHRDRRRRRRRARARRVGGRDGRSGLARPRPVRRHLPVDAAPLLGPGHPLRRRLPGRRRADAAGRGRPGAGRAGRCSAYTLALWASTLVLVPVADLGLDLRRDRVRARRGVRRRVRRSRRAIPRPAGRCRCSRSRSPTSRCCSAPWPLDVLVSSGW